MTRRPKIHTLGNQNPKQNPWEVHSDSGLEGVFFDEDSARFYAEEIRGGGARGIRVERRVKRLPHRNPPSGRWDGARRNPTYVGFHGSHRPIKDPTTMPMNPGDFGVGMYFSSSEVDAGSHGFDTYRSSIHLESPFIAPAETTPELDRIRLAFGINEEDVYDEDEGAWHGLVGLINFMIEGDLIRKKQFIAIMRKLGYDGIFVPNEVVRLSHRNRRAKGDYIVIFDFASIKGWDPAFATLDEWRTAYRASMEPGERGNPIEMRGNPSSRSPRAIWQGAYRELLSLLHTPFSQDRGVEEANRLLGRYDEEILAHQRKIARSLKEPFSYEHAFRELIARAQNPLAQVRGTDEAIRILNGYAKEVLDDVHRFLPQDRERSMSVATHNVRKANR